MNSGANISRCTLYRYKLWRCWGIGPWALWVMLNPSTADHVEDDPTIRRCIGFTKAWGGAGIMVMNLFALRATDPKQLMKADNPVGVRNDAVLKEAASSDRYHWHVAAWGTHGRIMGQGLHVRSLLQGAGVKLQHLGLTKRGHPKHPLYLPNGLLPQEWEAP